MENRIVLAGLQKSHGAKDDLESGQPSSQSGGRLPCLQHIAFPAQYDLAVSCLSIVDLGAKASEWLWNRNDR
jgi:hypothetical protein